MEQHRGSEPQQSPGGSRRDQCRNRLSSGPEAEHRGQAGEDEAVGSASVEQDGDASLALLSPEEPRELWLERGVAPLPRPELRHVGKRCYASMPRSSKVFNGGVDLTSGRCRRPVIERLLWTPRAQAGPGEAGASGSMGRAL